TPVMLIGLLAAPLALRSKEPRTENQEPGIRNQVLGSRFSVLGSRIDRWSSEQQILLALAAFALFWTLVMTLGLKKFDRSALPTWPALLVLSAAGWKWLLWDALEWLSVRWGVLTATRLVGLRAASLVLLLALEIIPLARYHPYYLSYYN